MPKITRKLMPEARPRLIHYFIAFSSRKVESLFRAAWAKVPISVRRGINVFLRLERAPWLQNIWENSEKCIFKFSMIFYRKLSWIFSEFSESMYALEKSLKFYIRESQRRWIRQSIDSFKDFPEAHIVRRALFYYKWPWIFFKIFGHPMSIRHSTFK